MSTFILKRGNGQQTKRQTKTYYISKDKLWRKIKPSKSMPKEREVAALGRVVREGFIVSLEHLDSVPWTLGQGPIGEGECHANIPGRRKEKH